MANCEGCEHEAECREQVCLYDFYEQGRTDVLNELMDIRDGLPFKYADHWTSRDSEAITMLFSEYEQLKEQTDVDNS